jgi:hypothetical protein
MGAADGAGTYSVTCKWTDPQNPNHVHSGSTSITLTNDPCPTRNLTDQDVDFDCRNAIQPIRCNIKVKYDPDLSRGGAKSLSAELDTAIYQWNSYTYQPMVLVDFAVLEEFHRTKPARNG